MVNRPYLVFPGYTSGKRRSLNSFVSKINTPSRDKQSQKFNGPMRELQRTVRSRLATIQQETEGINPEMVLVLETVGSIENFYTAVKNTDGFSWLVEHIGDEIKEDENFYEGDEPGNKSLEGRLYLLMTNKTAMNNLKKLWDMYQKNQKLPYGQRKWRKVFNHLKDIRPWGIKDRLEDTGLIEYWKEDLKIRKENLKFEVEFWFTEDQLQRQRIEKNIEKRIANYGGKKISSAIIPEIKYHALLGEIPAKEVEILINSFEEGKENKLFKCESIMFFNPLPQANINLKYEKAPYKQTHGHIVEVSDKPPVVALLDGLPLQNHKSLANRLIIDDPEEFEEYYQAEERRHGTSMASIILNGDLNNDYIKHERPIYVRPILKPEKENFFSEIRREIVTEDNLFVNQIYQAVIRMMEGDNNNEPIAPQVKIINLSVGDVERPYIRHMSALARLLDWLSWKYKVLFIVSAGNYTGSINIKKNTDDTIAEKTLQDINDNLKDRKIISPAESINAITVGAQHKDYIDKEMYDYPHIIDLFDEFENIPSPVSRFGLGYGRSIKPDVLLPGGRQVYNKKIASNNNFTTEFEVNTSNLRPPGLKVAFPGQSGQISAEAYTVGTSNAAAMATHKAAEIYEIINQNRDILDIDEDRIAVLIKALLVHYADWHDGGNILEDVLNDFVKISSFRRHAQKFLGYGFVDPDQEYGCTDNKATLIATSFIKSGEGHKYRFPLPESLISRTVLRRLVITLSWFTPINPNYNEYRLARLYFDPPDKKLEVSRSQANHHAVKRGTLQHEVLEGDKAAIYKEDDDVIIWVNCRDKTNILKKKGCKIPYALTVTLDLPQAVDINIYDEIKEKIRIRERERVEV